MLPFDSMTASLISPFPAGSSYVHTISPWRTMKMRRSCDSPVYMNSCWASPLPGRRAGTRGVESGGVRARPPKANPKVAITKADRVIFNLLDFCFPLFRRSALFVSACCAIPGPVWPQAFLNAAILLTGTVRIDRASHSRLDPVLDPMLDQTPDRSRLYALQLTATRPKGQGQRR